MNIFLLVFFFILYNGIIKENLLEGIVVLGLENCYVEDCDEFGIKMYKIIKGNERGYFKVEKYEVGKKSFLCLLVINKLIKWGKIIFYMMLVVEVEDMRVLLFIVCIIIGVKIEEVNDYVFVFNESSYE